MILQGGDHAAFHEYQLSQVQIGAVAGFAA